jgi:long-subunit acyl-CoA synthetase (AMP-forming)
LVTNLQLDFLIASWAIHRIGGICLLMHPTSSAAEIKRHIELTKCRVLFTCRSLLQTANEVLAESEVQDPRVYLLDLPEELGKEPSLPDQGQQTVEQLISAGADLPSIQALKWAEGQGKEQVAYLCPTSGTSGLQVGRS